MKQVFFLLTILFLEQISFGQQFSFQMFFEDAIGNKDTIVLGYDNTATDTLDLAFGEVNIISIPYKSGLDVRAGNVWFQHNFGWATFGQISFETKKQIVPNTCGTGNFWALFPIAEINLVSNHFPVKVYWNKLLFNDICRNGSVFTSVHPGGWWDTGGFREVLNSKDSAIFYQNQYYYLNGTDTVQVYWATFADSTLLTLDINELTTNKNKILLFPNPSSDFVTVSFNKSFGEINRIDFYNSFGQIVLTSKLFNNIDISKLSRGLYFIKVMNNNGHTVITKLQKI